MRARNKDNIPLYNLLGGKGALVLDTLFNDEEYDYSVSEISRRISVSRNTVYKHIENLKECGIITERQCGAMTLYKIGRGEMSESIRKIRNELLK